MANIEVQLLNYAIMAILNYIAMVIPLWNNVSFEISFFPFCSFNFRQKFINALLLMSMNCVTNESEIQLGS